jgi:hypothetical protein
MVKLLRFFKFKCFGMRFYLNKTLLIVISGENNIMRIQKQLLQIWTFVFLSLSSFQLNAQSGWKGFSNINEKAEKKENSRWTLSEWMQQKDSNRLMDLWLSLNSPSPYEFFIQANYLTYQYQSMLSSQSSSYNSSSFGLSAFASIVGLEAQSENNTAEKYNDILGMLQLRLLGHSVQGTRLLLQYGSHTKNYTDGRSISYSQTFSSADLNLYMNKQIGLQGLYRLFSPIQVSVLGEVSGQRTEAGLFLDFKAVRVSGNWYKENEYQNLNGVRSEFKKEGYVTGLRIFF